MGWKKFTITLFFILLLLIIYSFFPIKNQFQQLITPFVFFVVLPLIFNKFFLKNTLGDLGIKIGNYKAGLFLSGCGIVATGVILFLFIKYTNVLRYYTIPKSVIYDFNNFLYYELLLVIFIVFIYELFFRGFFMFNLKNKTNNYLAIIIQVIVFLIFIGVNNNSLWEFLPYLVFSPIAGLIVVKSESIIYSSITQFLIVVFFDASVIEIINK